jgi:MFS family permease
MPQSQGISRTPSKGSNTASPEEKDVEAGQDTSAVNREHINPREGIPPWQWILSLIGLYLAALLYGTHTLCNTCTWKLTRDSTGLDTTIAADVQASVYQRLGEIEHLPWVGLGFPMASVAVILLLGRAYGLFNIKFLLLSSLATFEVGSALCGAAPSMSALIVGRVIAGIGGAGMYLG